jgi:hypothetical protein
LPNDRRHNHTVIAAGRPQPGRLKVLVYGRYEIIAAMDKAKGNYAFIDNQNLNLGIQKNGWKMDWRKFRKFLKDNFNIEQAYMFIGYMPENEDLYNQMHEAGYLVVLKPTLEMFKVPVEGDAKDEKDENKLPVKGNVDAELVLYAVKEIPHYKKAIIISGDGDFFSLKEQGRLLKLMVPNRMYSSLLKPFEADIVRLDQYRKELSYGRVMFKKSNRR